MLPLLSVVIFVYSKETLLHFHNTPEVSDSGAVYPEEFVEQMMATPDAKLCKALAQMRFSWGENGVYISWTRGGSERVLGIVRWFAFCTQYSWQVLRQVSDKDMQH